MAARHRRRAGTRCACAASVGTAGSGCWSRSRSPGRRPPSSCRRLTDTDVPWWDALPDRGERRRPMAARSQVRRELADLDRRQRRRRGAVRVQGAVADDAPLRSCSSRCRSSAGAAGWARQRSRWPRHERGCLRRRAARRRKHRQDDARARRSAPRSPSAGFRSRWWARSCASSAPRMHARRAATSRPGSPRTRPRGSTQPRRSGDVVVADTTALMIAVYSDFVFGDTSLYDERAGGAAPRRPDAGHRARPAMAGRRTAARRRARARTGRSAAARGARIRCAREHDDPRRRAVSPRRCARGDRFRAPSALGGRRALRRAATRCRRGGRRP